MSKKEYIKQRLSLREPLKDALDIVADIAETIGIQKYRDENGEQDQARLDADLQKITAKYPGCTDFEHDFASVSLSIATGVGKTRLMGACIAYLHLKKKVKNFFVLAPNLTIYNQLIEVFGNPAHPKYVFKGISEFVNNKPLIITGDNYLHNALLLESKAIRINVFNISKFNRDSSKSRKKKDKGLAPKIKRLSEYLGISYWDFLKSQDDLVLLMDEAHRYREKASLRAINDLHPTLGIELTATPSHNNQTFQNIVYEYNLAQALVDEKYVKSPAVATRTDFNAQGLTPEEIEKIKLEDSISVHEQVKNELELYSRSTGNKLVKPFILVVCRDTTHSKNVEEYIRSEEFFQGSYRDKVLRIDSTVTADEDEGIKLLGTVEKYDNPIEIVIHVAMLAEGWDVNNLYTICPLRRADAIILIEQTIGRGLRLPFGGVRVGIERLDRLTVIAHDNFTRVIERAQNPNSILNKFTFIRMNNAALQERTIVTTSPSKMEAQLQKEIQNIEAEELDEDVKKQKLAEIETKQIFLEVIPGVVRNSRGIQKIEDLSSPKIKEKVLGEIKKVLNQEQLLLPNIEKQLISSIETQYEAFLASYTENIIEIPRISLIQEEVETYFENFDLDVTKGFDFRVLKEEIRVQGLTDDYLDKIGVRYGAHDGQDARKQLVSELINYPEIDYDENKRLLFKLAGQAIEALSKNLDEEEDFLILMRQSRKIIVSRIWEQLKKHFVVKEPEYGEPKVLPFTKIESWHFSVNPEYGRVDFRQAIEPLSHVPKYLFFGFQKSCHPNYKFHSNPEKVFSQVLEADDTVEKWLCPAEKQFWIFWDNNKRRYHPDFVVERKEAIYIVEVKAQNNLETDDVQQKKRAAEIYCKYATEYNQKHEKKVWRYVLLSDEDLTEAHINSTFDALLQKKK